MKKIILILAFFVSTLGAKEPSEFEKYTILKLSTLQNILRLKQGEKESIHYAHEIVGLYFYFWYAHVRENTQLKVSPEEKLLAYSVSRVLKNNDESHRDIFDIMNVDRVGAEDADRLLFVKNYSLPISEEDYIDDEVYKKLIERFVERYKLVLSEKK